MQIWWKPHHKYPLRTKPKKIRELGHTELSSFGSVTDYNKDALSQILVSLVDQKYAKKETGMYPTLSVTEKGYEFMNQMHAGESPELSMDEPEIEVEPEKVKLPSKSKIKSNLEYNQELFEKFRVLRKSLAEQNRVPPYVVASDKTLIELAHYLPKDTTQLLNINGFGVVKAERYGKPFMDMIRDHS